MAEYIIRFERAQAMLKDEGVELPTKAVGYLLHRQANLDPELDGRLTAWLAGDYSKDNVLAKLRRLERVHQEGSKKAFVFDDPENPEGDNWGEETQGETYYPEDSEDDKGYIYLGDAEPSEVYEEEDLLEALASYQEVRQRIKDQRLGRKYFKSPGAGKGHFPKGPTAPKGKGKGPPRDGGFGAGRGTGKWNQGGRGKIHVEELKLRTRCRSCGQVGHWSRECPSNRAAPSSSASSASTHGKPGSATSFYWGSGSASGGSPSVAFITLQQVLRRQQEKRNACLQFCGVSTSEGEALVDTAGQDGLIGKPSLLRRCSALRHHGLACKWLNKTAAARGIGGTATTVGVAELPLGLAGVSGILECTVISEDVPLLLPISLMRSLGAEISLPKNTLHLTYVGALCNMNTLHSGHAAVSVLEFGPNGWTLPSQCKGTRVASDFRASSSPVQQHSGFASMREIATPTSQTSFATHVGGAGPEGHQQADRRSATEAQRSSRPSQGGTPKLARHWGQALLFGVLGAAAQCSHAVPGGSCQAGFLAKEPGLLEYYRGSGSHEQGGVLQGLYQPGARAGDYDECEGHPRGEWPDVPPRGTLPQRRRQANWVHCARCLSRWRLTPEAAAQVTGRALQEVAPEPAAKGKAKAKPAATSQIEDSKTAGPMESDYLRVIEDQKEKMQYMQAQLELLTGTTDQIDMAAEACCAIEGSLLSLDARMQQEAQTVITEFRRLKLVEEESRARSRHFPTRDTKDEWIKAADNLRIASGQMNQYYQDMMRQRAQVTSLLLRSGQ